MVVRVKNIVGWKPIIKSVKIKHTRADDVQLSVDEIENVNNELNKSGFLGNDYLTMRRLEIEHEILRAAAKKTSPERRERLIKGIRKIVSDYKPVANEALLLFKDDRKK